MEERAAGDVRLKEQRYSSKDKQEQHRLSWQCNPFGVEDVRIQDCIKVTPTTSSSGSRSISYRHDCHEHLTIDSSLSSISCSISNSSSSGSSSSRSSRPTTPGDIATACRSHLPGVDFSAFGFGESGSGTSGGSDDSGSSAYTKTEPPSSDASSCYGFPKEYVSTGFAFPATIEASGNSPAPPVDGGCITSKASDGGGKNLRCSPGNGAFPADSSRSRRTASKAKVTSKGYCDRALSTCSLWESSVMEVRRLGVDGIGGTCRARPSPTFVSVPCRGGREELDGSDEERNGTIGGVCKATSGDQPLHRLRPSPSSYENASSEPASTSCAAAAASAEACRATIGEQRGYRSAVDHVNLEDGDDHTNKDGRIVDAGVLDRGARFPVTIRIPRHGRLDQLTEQPEVSTAKRARLTLSSGGDCVNDKLRDGNERGGKAGATKQRGREKDNGNAESSAGAAKNHRKWDKCSHNLPFDGMDDGSFPVLSTPQILRTTKKKSWTSSTTCCTPGGAAGGNPAACSGHSTDISDMMKSFGDIKLSSHSELPSGTSRGRVLLRTRAVRAIQSFPDVVTCFRDGGSMHAEEEDRKWRGGRYLSDSVMPMDQVCPVGLRKEGTGDTVSGQVRGTGHRGTTGQDHHIEHVSKGGIGITDGSSRAGFGCEYVGISGGVSADSIFVEVEAAAWEGPSHDDGEIVVGGREFGRWTRSNSGSSTCSTSSPHSSIDVVEVWKEKGGRRAPRPVTQAARSDNTRQSQKHRLN